MARSFFGKVEETTPEPVYDPPDLGPMTEFEEMVGTKEIVAKYQKLIYEEEPPASDSSDEPFQFNMPDKKAKRIVLKQTKKRKILAHRQRSDYEKIRVHRKRYGGCGVFRKESENVQNKYSSLGVVPDNPGVVAVPPNGEEEELAIDTEDKSKTLPLRRIDKLKTEKKPTRNRK